MSASLRTLLVSLGLCLPACLELGGSWDPSAMSAASATTTGTTSATTTGTTSTTGTGTTTTGSTSGTETGSEVEQCDIWEQDCPDGEKCVPWTDSGYQSWTRFRCVPVEPNPVGVGKPCNATETEEGGVVDDCDAKSVCDLVDPRTGIGVCNAFCQGSSRDPMCAPGFSCAIIASGFPVLCMPWCDPLLQDCLGGDLCLPVGESFGCALDASGEEGQYGDPCEYANACDPGLVCLNPEYVPDCRVSGCCSPFCDTSKPNTCPGDGQECLPWWEEGMAPPGFEDVGVCGVPQP